MLTHGTDICPAPCSVAIMQQYFIDQNEIEEQETHAN